MRARHLAILVLVTLGIWIGTSEAPHEAVTVAQGTVVKGQPTAVEGTIQLRPRAYATLEPAEDFAATMGQDFEGDWPASGWTLDDRGSSDGGEYLLGKRDCHPHTGSFGGWLAGGGAQGNALDCSADHPHNANTWAMYGPFDLTQTQGIPRYLSLYPYETLTMGKTPESTTKQMNIFRESKEWTYTLSGDLVGDTYAYDVTLHTFGVCSCYKVAFLVKQGGTQPVLVAESDALCVASESARFTSTLQGIDPATRAGDRLIFRVTHIDGAQGALCYGGSIDTHIKVTAASDGLDFYLWGRTEGGANCPADFLFVGSSIDGAHFAGLRYCGDWTGGQEENGYHHLTLDLSNHLGESQVWIAFVFRSNSVTADSGFTVDDIALNRAIPPNRVDIAGPTTGLVHETYGFGATVYPTAPTPPIAYTWSPTPTSGQGTGTATYEWTTAGVKTIAFTATNAGGTVTGTHVITVRQKVYIPVVLRN